MNDKQVNMLMVSKTGKLVYETPKLRVVDMQKVVAVVCTSAELAAGCVNNFVKKTCECAL